MKQFKDKDAEKLANDESVPVFKQIEEITRKKLELLITAKSLKDLFNIPGNRLEKLGKTKNKYSIRVNDQYRIVFV